MIEMVGDVQIFLPAASDGDISKMRILDSATDIVKPHSAEIDGKETQQT